MNSSDREPSSGAGWAAGTLGFSTQSPNGFTLQLEDPKITITPSQRVQRHAGSLHWHGNLTSASPNGPDPQHEQTGRRCPEHLPPGNCLPALSKRGAKQLRRGSGW